MLKFEDYQPLFNLADSIDQLQTELLDNPDSGWLTRSKLNKSIIKLNQELNEQCEQLIKKTLDVWDSEQSLSDFLNEELSLIKQGAGPSWYVAIDDVNKRLRELADTESKKSVTRKMIERYGWWRQFLHLKKLKRK